MLAWVHAENPVSCIISAGEDPMQNSRVKCWDREKLGEGIDESNGISAISIVTSRY